MLLFETTIYIFTIFNNLDTIGRRRNEALFNLVPTDATSGSSEDVQHTHIHHIMYNNELQLLNGSSRLFHNTNILASKVGKYVFWEGIIFLVSPTLFYGLLQGSILEESNFWVGTTT